MRRSQLCATIGTFSDYATIREDRDYTHRLRLHATAAALRDDWHLTRLYARTMTMRTVRDFMRLRIDCDYTHL